MCWRIAPIRRKCVRRHDVFQRTRPIRDAVRDFFGNLSEGISQAITAVAYILPWLLVVILGLYLVRFLWRRRGR